MSDDNTKPEEQMEATAAAAERSEAETEAVGNPVEALMAENADLKDKVLRTMAEMENLRRRTEKQVSDAKQYAVSTFARDMLTVGDNLRRALDSLPEEERAGAAAGLVGLIEGVEMTERELLNQLGKNGVKKLDPEGQKFDPNYHQAMFEVPNPDVPNNTVVQVVQAGYVIGERVLRPAMVGVAKGGPKDVPAADKTDGAAPGQTVDKSA